jgi:sodium transport system permease protein
MWKVYFKELLELTRDIKTLIFTLLLPTLIMPVLMFGFIMLVSNLTSQAMEEELQYTVIGGEHYPPLVEHLAVNESFKRLDEQNRDEAVSMINDKTLSFAIVIPPDTPGRLTQGFSAQVELIFDDSTTTSILVFERVRATLKKLNELEIQKRYTRLNLSEAQGKAVNKPIEIISTSTVDSRASIGEKIGGVLPYLLMLIGFAGAMYPAIDLGVGEKERGTLETLLLTPIPRFKLVFAKFLVIFSTSFIAVFLTLLSFTLVVSVIAPVMVSGLKAAGNADVEVFIGVLKTISIFDVALMILMVVPVAAIFAALLLSVSIYSRTFKEAQNYMSPLMIVMLLPLALAMVPGVYLNSFWAAVPITNVGLAIKEIFKGTIELSMLGIIFVSTTLLAGALLALCNWWFQREEVLFRN